MSRTRRRIADHAVKNADDVPFLFERIVFFGDICHVTIAVTEQRLDQAATPRRA